jgi:hypothetical protein
MLANTPALAIADSVEMYDWMGVGPRNFSTHENTKAVSSTLKLRMVGGKKRKSCG